MNFLDNLKFDLSFCPRFLAEAIFLIPLMIFLNYIADGPYWWKENILSLMILYGLNWFVFRITATIFCLYPYEISDFLQPLYFVFMVFVLMVFIQLIFPNYDMNKSMHVSDDIMAQDCNKAKWNLLITYQKENGIYEDISFTVVGNTKEAKKDSEIMIKKFISLFPEKRYERHDLNLYYLPRKYCQEKGYPLRMSLDTDAKNLARSLLAGELGN